MKILYISTACSQKKYNYLFKLSNGMIEPSIQKFHYSIITGLKENNNDIECLCGYQISRKYSKKILFKPEMEKENNIKYIYPFLYNFSILKHITTILFFIIYTLYWILRYHKTEKIIFIDSAFVSVSPFITFISKLFNVKILAIVADIYDYMSPELNKERKRNFIEKILLTLNKFCFNNYDYFVLLTEKMNNIVNKNKKDYIVMEGILDAKKIDNSPIEHDKKIIMYTGGVNSRYGLKNLIEGFHKLKNNKVELHLYGNTDMINFINKYTDLDKRIKYFGCVPNNEILKKQSGAYILVNPRPTKDEYTMYSFPSKTMEYMATGNICVSTKLDGIPKEYEKYINFFENYDSDSIYKKLEELIDDKNEKKLKEKAKNAQNFVMSEKNKKNQTKRIIEMLKLNNKEHNIFHSIQIISILILTYISIVPFSSNKYIYLFSMIMFLYSTFKIEKKNLTKFIIKYKVLMILFGIWILNYLLNYIIGRADLLMIHMFTYIRIISIVFVGLYIINSKNNFFKKTIIIFSSFIIFFVNIHSTIANLNYYSLSRILSTGIQLNINSYGIANYTYIYGLLFLIILLIINTFKKNFKINLEFVLLLSSIVLLIIAEFMFSFILLILSLLLYYFKINTIKKMAILIGCLILSIFVFSKPLSYGFAIASENIDNYNIKIRLSDISKMLNGDIENTVDLKLRIDVYKKSLNTFLKKPLIGVGYSTDDNEQIGGHSTLLDECAKFGIVGLITLLSAIIYTLKCFYNEIKNTRVYFTCSIVFILFMAINNALFVSIFYFLFFIVPIFINNNDNIKFNDLGK